MSCCPCLAAVTDLARATELQRWTTERYLQLRTVRTAATNVLIPAEQMIETNVLIPAECIQHFDSAPKKCFFPKTNTAKTVWNEIEQ